MMNDPIGTSGRIKPQPHKAYGSIGHLPGSRLGPADHRVPDGQAKIATEHVRNRHDRVIVTEKLDGSCTAVTRINGEIVAIGRAGWLAQSSPYEQHQLFAAWVRANTDRFRHMGEGERYVGEWLAQAHGTRYALTETMSPWVMFDFMVTTHRKPWDVAQERAKLAGLPTPYVISDGPALSINDALDLLGTGQYGAIDPVEGAVWRVESRGAFDFICKYVRQDKVDGVYLPEISGRPAIWNWRPT